MEGVWIVSCILTLSCIVTVDSVKQYGLALEKSILFYNAQRSGKLPANNPISWRGDSALNDCVVGGWYDAGDHIKFGLPASFATTALLWSLVRQVLKFRIFKDGYQRAGQLDQMYDMIKWPLDYFLSAWRSSRNELTVQVADGTDHNFWGRAEDMVMARPCQVINTSIRGSDVAAGTAAALAAGSIVFKEKGDTVYANQLLSAAQSLYTYAKTYSDKDELCEAGMWLYKATNTAQYLTDARTFAERYAAWAYSWEDKQLACHQLLYEATRENQYRNLVVTYFNSWLPGGSVRYTPCGLAWRHLWGANGYAGSSAFVALVAAESGIDSTRYRKWAAEQVNYILGDNHHSGGCYSYMVGYGSKYPQQPHHAGASCPDRPASCGWAQYSSPSPNPQVLHGALVGGPDIDDDYVDLRSDYVQNEVSISYNSGLHGALAGLLHLQASSMLPATSNLCPCNQ
ncbi:endoglucanase E-4 [Biomphalaria pfeifferi]|uniref:Endoglucanase n=1 Tax=Biomphalaria pfeifferi TaxID=112525 RepID=A0AAD8FDL4_BIOPF|nr:endoglucanase E-4 [Biomphalaria pfeifferi]